MKTILFDIVSIQTGLFAKTTLHGDFVYLQSKHFDENGLLKSILQPDLKANSHTEKHLLKPGDVLFASKGTKNFAAVYVSKNNPAVASTSFFVIRLKDEYRNRVLPQYLSWAINHSTSQKFLKENAIGSAMVSISKVVLGQLEILIPPLETQKKILHINDLYTREKKLKQKIELLRNQKVQQQIFNSIK